MRGTNLNRAREKAARDAAIDKMVSKTVFRIRPDQKIEFRENPRPKLDIIAIIGSTERFAYGPFCGERVGLNEVVLAEIGIGRTRPYHDAKGRNIGYGTPGIIGRKKYFSCTADQYRIFAPLLFSHLDELATRKVAGWKNSTFTLPMGRTFYSIRRKKTEFSSTFGEFPRGARFTFSLSDSLFLQDIYWAETKQNWRLLNEVKGLANFIDKRLALYRRPKGYRGRRKFTALAGVKEIAEMVAAKGWPAYIRRLLFAELAARRKNFYTALKEVFLSTHEENSREEMLCTAAEKTAPQTRLNGLHLRVTTGLTGQKDYIVAEIFPDLDKTERRRRQNSFVSTMAGSPPSDAEDGNDESENYLPF